MPPGVSPAAEPTSPPAGAPGMAGKRGVPAPVHARAGRLPSWYLAGRPGVRAAERRTMLRPHRRRRRARRRDARMPRTRQPTPQVFGALLTMEGRGGTRDRRREGPRDRQAPARVLETGRGHLIRGELALLVILPQNILPVWRKDDPLLVFPPVGLPHFGGCGALHGIEQDLAVLMAELAIQPFIRPMHNSHREPVSIGRDRHGFRPLPDRKDIHPLGW